MRAYLGAKAYHLTTIGDGVDAVDQVLLGAGLTFTRTPVTVAWPGGRGDGVEFAFVVSGGDQRLGMDIVQRLQSSGLWLRVHLVDGSVPM